MCVVECVCVNQMKLPEGKVFKPTKTYGFLTKYAVKLWNSLSLQTKGLHGLKRDLYMFLEQKFTGVYQLHRNPVHGAKAQSCTERQVQRALEGNSMLGFSFLTSLSTASKAQIHLGNGRASSAPSPFGGGK